MARRKTEVFDWYVSDRKWRRFDPEVRRAVLERTPRTTLLGHQAKEVADMIREMAPTKKRGDEVAGRFLDEVERLQAEDAR